MYAIHSQVRKGNFVTLNSASRRWTTPRTNNHIPPARMTIVRENIYIYRTPFTNVLIDPSIVNKVILYPTGVDRQGLMIILLFQHIWCLSPRRMCRQNKRSKKLNFVRVMSVRVLLNKSPLKSCSNFWTAFFRPPFWCLTSLLTYI